jgi:hypothetical protein
MVWQSKKNRHLLEVARSLMFTMNVPKFLWGEVVKTATYSINRMPLRVLSHKTPAECLIYSNEFVVPPKVFGCVCFVHDYRNSVRKLDPQALKCVFMGYSSSKKGYRCWCPLEHHFLSMDVTFHENEPYYGICSEFGIYLSPPEEKQERGSIYGEGPTVVPVLAPTLGESQISNNTLGGRTIMLVIMMIFVMKVMTTIMLVIMMIFVMKVMTMRQGIHYFHHKAWNLQCMKTHVPIITSMIL